MQFAVEATRPNRRLAAWSVPASDTARHAPPNAWGWLPGLCLVGACGLLVMVCANTLSLAGAGLAEPLFWAGLFTLVAPFSARLASAQASRRERLGLAMLLGLAFYLVKVLHSPFAFTFGDELLHLHNANAMLQYGVLFHPNPILPVSAYYPGLESVTAALAALAGLPVFTAGLIVIGAARLILVAALFLFYEQISGSARAAGLAALLYMANSNYLFWSAQFSYESLALPLAVMVVYAAARRSAQAPGRRAGLTLVAMLGTLTVVITHHLTSYALAGFLALVALAAFVRSWFIWDDSGPWDLALLAGAAAVGWLLFVATVTLGYLSTIFSRAFLSLVEMVAGQAQARRLFESHSGDVAPLWERVAGFGSVTLLALAQPPGLLQFFRRCRANMYALALAGASLAYFGVQVLRFTSAGWETGNRASEFLFVGLAFIVALAAVSLLGARPGQFKQALFATGAALIFTGGVVAGWSRELRLAQPYRVAAGGRIVETQGMAAARWALARLGPGNHVAADSTNALLLLDYGEQFAYSGRNYGIHEVIANTPLADWQLALLRDLAIRYVAVDSRRASWDQMIGLYFALPGQPPAPGGFIDPGVYDKFERQPEVSRIYDSGDIVLYDIGLLTGAAPLP